MTQAASINILFGDITMRHITRPSACVALATALACVSASGSAARTTVEAPPTTVENPATLHGLGRVAIGAFTVDILDRVEASADIGGIELVTGAPTDIIVNLVGTDPARYAALVEAMYAQFAADLTAQGYTVVSNTDLLANPDFAKFKHTEAGATRLEKTAAGHNHYVSAQGLPMYVVDEAFFVPKGPQFGLPFGKKPVRDPYVGWGTSFGAGFTMGDFAKQRFVAKSLGAAILDVRITLLGGQAHINRDFWRTSGSGKIDGAMTFVPAYNRVVVVPADGAYARVALGQPIVTNKLGDLVGTTSAANKAAQTAGNVAIAASRFLGAFAGGGGGMIGAMHYGNRSSYELRTDQPTFETELTRGFAQVSTTLVGEMARSR